MLQDKTICEVEIMPDYKKLYHKAYNAMTDAERLVDKAATMLRTVQHECEEIYVDANDAPISLIDGGKEPEHDEK